MGEREYPPTQHFPKCLQKHSLLRGCQNGLPHSGYLMETTGTFKSQEDFTHFLAGYGVFLVVVVIILLISFFFLSPKLIIK